MQRDTAQEMLATETPVALRVSNKLRGLVDLVGRSAAWLIVPLVLVTVIDVVIRKLVWVGPGGRMQGAQLWLVDHFGRIFESTLLQEMEWHFHTALFALALGFGTIYNTHVRVDLVRNRLNFSKQVWLEFAGLTFFMIPFLVIVIWFAVSYAYQSYAIGEISSSTVGLTHRWIIKSVLVAGLVVAVIAGVAVWLQVVVLLWSTRAGRFPLMTLEWPEEAGTKIEGKQRLTLEDIVSEPEIPPALAQQAPREAAE
jgi:TRAP-type mannitol/chloroaromatic compound transport system permease small subunit